MKAFEKVYNIVSDIPKGKVMTYGQIAKMAKVNPRVVGFAMHGNKDTKKVPCHRVVGANGKLTGYAHGVEKKEEILKKEGVQFNKDVVDLSKSLFTPQL